MIIIYGAGTTNTRKVTIALEELGLSYTPRRIGLDRAEQKEDW